MSKIYCYIVVQLHKNNYNFWDTYRSSLPCQITLPFSASLKFIQFLHIWLSTNRHKISFQGSKNIVITLGEVTTWNIWKETLTFPAKALHRAFAWNIKVSFHIFQVVASPKVIASCYPQLPTLAPIVNEHYISCLQWGARYSWPSFTGWLFLNL